MKQNLHRRVERLQGRPSHLDSHQQLVSELTHTLLGLPGELDHTPKEPDPEQMTNRRHQFPFE